MLRYPRRCRARASLVPKQINEPLELKQATAEDEAVIAGQSYVQHTYDPPNHITAIVFLQYFRDALFASGWKLIDVTKLAEVAIQPETVNVSAHYRENGRNIYARFTQEPDRPYQVNVADVDAEDWAAQLARECRVRIYSIHFEHDRPDVKLIESEPTLRKLAGVIVSKNTRTVEIQGHVDNIGEAAAPAREMLSLARAKSVAGWLTTQGGVPVEQGDCEGLRENAADRRQRHRSRARLEPPHRGRAAGLRTIESTA